MRTFNEFVQYKQNAPLAEALVLSGIDCEQFCETVLQLASEINPRDPEAINELFRGLGALFGAGSRAVGRGAETVGRGALQAGQAVGRGALQAGQAVGSAIDTGISTVGQAGIKAGQAVGRGALQAGKAVGSAIDTGISTVGQAGIKAGQAVGRGALQAGQAVGGAVQGAAHKVADIYQSAEHQGRVKDAMGQVENMKAQLAKIGVHGPEIDAAFAKFGNELTATLEKLTANQAGRVGPGGVTHARTGAPIA